MCVDNIARGTRWWLPLVLAVANAKVQAGPLRLSGAEAGSRWKYISKFGFGVGTGTYKVRIQLQSPRKMVESDVELHLDVFLDERWDEAEATHHVCDRAPLAADRKPIVLRAGGAYGEWVAGSWREPKRPHIVYFVLSDCNADGTFKLGNFTHKLRYQFQALQESGSQFSYEMLYVLPANGLFLLGFTVFIACFAKGARGVAKSAGSVHPVILTLCFSMLLQYLAQVLHAGHLSRYSFNGRGIVELEVLSELCTIFAQVTQASLLILIALGYTLLQSGIGELDLVIPLCLLVALIHIALVGFGKLRDDQYKFHENEGVVGWGLILLRMLLYAWFLWAAHGSSSEGGLQLQRFLWKFRIAGSAYFLAYPLIFLTTKLFAPYLQHCVMSCGLMGIQMGSNLWLAHLFLKRGDYFKVSTLSDSALPGGCKVGMVKEE